MPLTLLAPTLGCGLREVRDDPPFSMPLAVRQPKSNIDFPTTFFVLHYAHAHRCSPCSDDRACWSTHSTNSADRIKIRLPIFLTPGSFRRSIILDDDVVGARLITRRRPEVASSQRSRVSSSPAGNASSTPCRRKTG